MIDINEEQVRHLYLDRGLSMRAVSKDIKVPLATLSRFMHKIGIVARSKAQAQKNYLKTNDHQMRGRKHSNDTKEKISSSLGEFWESLSYEDRIILKRKIGAAWRRKWELMSEQARKLMMSDLNQKAKESQGKGSRLEHFIAEELRKRGYVVEERSTAYTQGKHFEVDLAIAKEMIAIEIDGPTHFLPIYGKKHLEEQKQRDHRKNQMINANGYNVLRIRDNNGPLSILRVNRIENIIQEIASSDRIGVWYIKQN